ncbi:MAG: lecithin retinol acyltransferase family protein [Oscillospiraceae bacterium]|nr:lecithin retinol acyltransferase family protein [Oscillospiraceae bacterium]
MTWQMIQPQPGDMIRVKIGPLYHYGIYISDDEVIQFGPNPSLRVGLPDSELAVCVTDVDEFLCGEFLEVRVPDRKERRKQNSPKKTVEIARSRIGQRGYHILHNNCEHFANECVTGEHFSSQTEGLRRQFAQLRPVEVYVAIIPEGEITPVLPAQRQEQIENTTHEGVKRQRYYVWKLLEIALKRSYDYEMKDLQFSRDEAGKWTCKECYFSLSHTDGAVAVAVSRKPVGVDLERTDHTVRPGLAEKILTEGEKNLSREDENAFLLQMWCAKEAKFKAGCEDVFQPKKISVLTGVRTQTVRLGEQEYCLAVAADNLTNLRIYENIQL